MLAIRSGAKRPILAMHHSIDVGEKETLAKPGHGICSKPFVVIFSPKGSQVRTETGIHVCGCPRKFSAFGSQPDEERNARVSSHRAPPDGEQWPNLIIVPLFVVHPLLLRGPGPLVLAIQETSRRTNGVREKLSSLDPVSLARVHK